MAMASKAKGEKAGLEIEPDAWQRFERALDVVAKSPPQPKIKKKKKSLRKKRT